ECHQTRTWVRVVTSLLFYLNRIEARFPLPFFSGSAPKGRVGQSRRMNAATFVAQRFGGD
ncbi:MAG: hypothetical protein ACE5EF_13865, partial [Dehalococcoidia bacterium]